MKNTQPDELLSSLQSGELSSVDLTQFFVEQNKHHSQLNALCLPLFESALELAQKTDVHFSESGSVGPLHGLPITIKECFDVPGTPSTFGVLRRQNDIPLSYDIYVDALREAGGVIIGKSNVSQLLAFIETDNPVYGRTSHPQNSLYSCGGSSGGEGALVGAGLSPLGLGNDIGGSVRVPAAVNGACGIKPTGQRLPDSSRLMPGQNDLPVRSAVGPISQDAFTLHTALQVMNQKAASMWQVEPLLDYREIDIAKLKIGYYVDDGMFPVCQSVRSGIQKAVKQLQAAGARVIEYRFPALQEAEKLFYGGMSIENGRLLFKVLGKDKPVENLAMLHIIAATSPFTKDLLSRIAGLCGQKQQSRILKLLGCYQLTDIPYLEQQITAYRQKVLQSMAHSAIGPLDAVISPILPIPAYLHNSFKHLSLAGTYSLVNNVTGFPAGVACVGTVENNDVSDTKVFNRLDLAERQAFKCAEGACGLPMAVQITAPPWREDIVLALIEGLHQPFTQAL